MPRKGQPKTFGSIMIHKTKPVKEVQDLTTIIFWKSETYAEYATKIINLFKTKKFNTKYNHEWAKELDIPSQDFNQILYRLKAVGLFYKKEGDWHFSDQLTLRLDEILQVVCNLTGFMTPLQEEHEELKARYKKLKEMRRE